MAYPEEDPNYTPPTLAEPGGAGERDVPQALAGLRLDQALARLYPEHSRSRLAAWLQAGHIVVDARPAKPAHKVWGGERIALLGAPETEGTDLPEDIALALVHEDEAVLVIDKPAGLVVHPGSGNRRGTLLNALLHHAPQLAQLPRAGIVHRLDKDTSGLLVVAKTLQAQTHLVRQLQARSVKRDYLAVAHGLMARDGEVDAPVGRDPANRVRMAVVAGGKPARTHYSVLERFERARATLLECSLDTGRTHQIRVHLQSIGHPLWGDPVYRAGAKTKQSVATRFARQALHAARLAFVHPASEQRMAFESPLPADMVALLAALRDRP
jgi:23S rRNA pseudouridine1911/1915/1917 synthase